MSDDNPIQLMDMIKGSGVELQREGTVFTGNCPFHEDQNGALLVDLSSNHWQCDGACQTGGSVAEWIMQREGVSQTHAQELIRTGQIEGFSSEYSNTSGPSSCAVSPVSANQDDNPVLISIVDYYHETLKSASECLEFLRKHRIDNSEALDRFKLGFCNRTLGYRLPKKNSKEGAAIRGQLQRLGVIKSSGHEFLRGSFVVPIINDGQVREMYGRKITPNLRAGTEYHVYLNSPPQGVFNLEAVKASDELILCQSIMDALTFWCAGYRNVTCSYGLELTDEQLSVLKTYVPQRLLIAYELTTEGNQAAQSVMESLVGTGIEGYRIEIPNGLDVNAYAIKEAKHQDALGQLIRKAVWMGEERTVVSVSTDDESLPETKTVPESNVLEEPVCDEVVEDVFEAQLPEVIGDSLDEVDAVAVSDTILPASTQPDAPETPEMEIRDNEVIVHFDKRRYRIRGYDKNLTYDQLKINLLVSNEHRLHVDSFDLYATRPRHKFIREAALELGVSEKVIKQDLSKLLLQLEILQEQNLSETLSPKSVASELTSQEHREAMTLLTDSDLMGRLLEDYGQCGLVGEETNKLVAYLAALSRKLDQPLAIMVQSTSAAGKTALMDAVLSFVPSEDRVQYSAMAGQSLFYMGDINLKHKVLAISEEEGASHAAYALKLLQSDGQLTIASTGKDPFTGKHTTHEYRVEGPVMIFSTTTALDVDEELLNRCLVLQVDENRDQTRAIHDWQRHQETLEGLKAINERKTLLRIHRNAQRLLKPLKVVNPYAEQLTFLDDKTRTRRDHPKYLTLIKTIALLHQYQREIKTTYIGDQTMEYIEVIPADIEMANQIAHDVMGQSLEELPPQTRELLKQVDAMVNTACDAQSINRHEYRFTRRDVVNHTGWGMTQVSVHLKRLEAFEYVLRHKGKKGQCMVYELLYNQEGDDGGPFMMGLIDVEKLKTIADNLTDSATPAHGAVSDTSRPESYPPSPAVMSDHTKPDGSEHESVPGYLKDSHRNPHPTSQASAQGGHAHG